MNVNKSKRVGNIFDVLQDVIDYYKVHNIYEEYRDELEYEIVKILLCSSMQRISEVPDKLLRKEHAAFTKGEQIWDFLYCDDAAEAFYLATAGGGAFFGRVGLFEAGYAFDAVVIDDGSNCGLRAFSPAERIERCAYLGRARVAAKYVDGIKVL